VNNGKPDLAVRLINTRDARDRPVEKGVGIVAHAVEVTATIEDVGDVVAGETITRFSLRDATSSGVRVVHTPELLPGD
jgi:hypothetical protein